MARHSACKLKTCLAIMPVCRGKTEPSKNILSARLIGEACIPNIDISNLRAIFVDKPPLAVAPGGTPGTSNMSGGALSAAQPGATLDLERRVFSYGLVLARVQAPMPAGVIRPAANVTTAPGSVTNLSIKNPGKVRA